MIENVSFVKFCSSRFTFIEMAPHRLRNSGLMMAPSMGYGSLSPTVKHTGQYSEGELCKFFKFWLFLQSKSVNNVSKLLQLLGTSPRSTTRASPLDPYGKSLRPLGISSPHQKKKKIPSAVTAANKDQCDFRFDIFFSFSFNENHTDKDNAMAMCLLTDADAFAWRSGQNEGDNGNDWEETARQNEVDDVVERFAT